MRIVHVNQFYIPGLSYQENILPHEQSKLGHEVWILTSDRLPHPKKYPESGGRLPQGVFREDAVRIWRLPSIVPIKSRAQIYLRNLNRVIYRIRPDVVNTHGLRFIPVLQVLSKRPFFVHVGDDHSDNGNLPAGPGNIIRFGVGKQVCSHLGRLGSKIFTSNPFAEQFVKEVYAARPESVHLLPLGINTDTFYPDPAKRKEWRSKLAVPDDSCVFITSGRLTPGKGFELFFRAFADIHRRCPSTRLAIAGSGTPEYEAQLHGLVKDLNVDGAVIFLKWMAERDLCACYNAADVGVMPGKLGGMKEILGCGRPLIAPDHLATSYLVERENGLTFTPGDRAGLALAMRRYAENPALRKRHGEKSLQVSRNQLSWANLARDSLRVYEDLLAEFREERQLGWKADDERAHKVP